LTLFCTLSLHDALPIFARRGEVAEELHVFTQVLVVPLPLVASDLDIDVGLAGVVDMNQRLRRRNRHDHQDHQRDDRPGHLDLGVFMEVRRLRTLGTAMGDHRIDHHAEYQCTDDHADPEDRHVQVEYGSTDIGHADWHVHVPG